MELEEKIKKEGIQIGKELEDKYNLSDLYYIHDVLENASQKPHLVQSDRKVLNEFNKKYINYENKVKRK